MYKSDIVLPGQSIEWRVAKPWAHQSAAEERDGIAGRIAEVCI
jgi:hypothetical protein